MDKKDVIIIARPTASGKSSFAIELAKKINGEIIGMDSMQIYKEMEIGTAKTTKEEMQGINHYLIDCIEPEEIFSVSNYQKLAFEYIEKILKKGKVPILVGGTGLYMDSVIYETKFLQIETDLEYRNFLENEEKNIGLNSLYKMAYEIDEQSAKKISPSDKKRIFRILEIYHQTKKKKSELDEASHPKELKYNYHVYITNWDRQILYDRINQRVDIMLEQGLIDEVKKYYEKHSNAQTSNQAIGYKEVKQYLDGKIDYDEMTNKLKQATRNYAKRQLTWFRKDKQNIFLDMQNNSLDYNISIIMKGINIGE